jgi:DNA-binding transcriptional LysR family regulator
VTQVAVSQQIKLVETELGAELFYRKQNKIFPTKEGEYFYRVAKDIIQKYDHAANMIKIHGKNKNITIAK